MSQRDDFVAWVRVLTGVPYIYGGKDQSGIDCSGCVCFGMTGAGCPLPRDMTAYEISEYFKKKKINPLQAPPGSLYFYGNPVRHVMTVISHFNDGGIILLGARGGNKTTITTELAAKQGAYVSTEIASKYWVSNFNFAVDPFQP